MSQSGKMKCKERRVQDTSSGRSHALRHITVSGLTLLSLFSTPPRGPDIGTFMIRSRMGKKTLARRGFVKKSARLSTVATNGLKAW